MAEQAAGNVIRSDGVAGKASVGLLAGVGCVPHRSVALLAVARRELLRAGVLRHWCCPNRVSGPSAQPETGG